MLMSLSVSQTTSRNVNVRIAPKALTYVHPSRISARGRIMTTWPWQKSKTKATRKSSTESQARQEELELKMRFLLLLAPLSPLLGLGLRLHPIL